MKVAVCPQCGAPASASAKRCEYCKSEFVADTLAAVGAMNPQEFDNHLVRYREAVDSNPSDGRSHLALGLCHLRLKVFGFATRNLARAVELMPERPEPYYYYALALIGGRKPRTLTMKEVRQIEECLATAMALDGSKAKYSYLAAIVKFEYYVVNGLRVPEPSPDQLLARTREQVVEQAEIKQLLGLITVPKDTIVTLFGRDGLV